MTPLQIFRDAIHPEAMAIDGTYQGVIAYANGLYAWPSSQVARYVTGGKHMYRYDVTGAIPHLASVLDVERYDATPDRAAQWVPERNRLHGDAACYTSLDSVPALLEAIGGENCWLIVASWSGSPDIVPELKLPANVKLAAVQYDNTPGWDLLGVWSPGWLGRHC